MRILIVDDDDIVLDMLSCALVDAGHTPLIAHDGTEGLEILRHDPCRMVISDWLMPQMDGLELCRQIRREGFPEYTYFILLTSRSDSNDVAKGLSGGADDFIAKPFNPGELWARVQAGERILALEKRSSVAESANRAKTEFLANMSHEIRTPMTAILGFADTLNAPGISESERHQAIGTIRRNADHLLSVIDNILDVSKIEAGRADCERIEYSPCKVVAEADSMMRSRINSAGLEFLVERASPIPRTAMGDPARLRQILVNLVGNAIKFTKKGSIRLISRCVNGEDSAPLLQFDVVDTGIGMTEEQAESVFQPFAQADCSVTRKYGGTGLGLTISKQFAQILGGDVIVVRAQTGVGTHMRATVATGPLDGVPMIEAAECEVPSASEVTTGNVAGTESPLLCHVLLAEDGPDNQRLIAWILRRAGARVTAVENGKLAVEAALAARTGTDPFDIILMDMQMPVMDGYAATASLRREGYTGSIVALTAHAMSHDRQKCIDAGCDDYAVKPINRTSLIELIRHQVLRCDRTVVETGTP